MKWPWVARSLADERLETTRRLSALLYSERIRFDFLMDKYTKLKLAGALPEAIPADVVPLVARTEDEMKSLIYEVAGKNLKQRAMMLKQLTVDRAAGLSDSEIERGIRYGISSDGVPA